MEFSYVPTATSTSKKPHGHKAGYTDAGDEGQDEEDEDGEGGKDGDDMKSTVSPSKTHTVNAGGAKSAAARATSMTHTNDQSPSDNPDLDESYESDPGDAQSGNPSSYESADNDRAQSSLSGSNPKYKNSGEADAADSANALEGCPCGYTSDRKNSAGARLPASGFIPSIATSVISALLLAFF